MNNPAAAAMVANLAQHLEAYLTEHDCCFARQTIERRHRDIFDIVCDTGERGLAEQRITAYVHDKLIFFEAAVPVTCTDSNAVVTLVNTLNLKHPTGTFQYDIRDGELNWTVYLAARDGKWPGDDNVGTVLTLAREMAGLLYRELVSIANALTTTEQ